MKTVISWFAQGVAAGLLGGCLNPDMPTVCCPKLWVGIDSVSSEPAPHLIIGSQHMGIRHCVVKSAVFITGWSSGGGRVNFASGLSLFFLVLNCRRNKEELMLIDCLLSARQCSRCFAWIHSGTVARAL